MATKRPTVNGDASTTASLTLFGPQSTKFSESRLLEIRNFILANPSLSFLVDAARELPSLGPTLEQAFPHLSKVPGAELDQLYQVLESGTLPNVRVLRNTLLAPLTVISQIVDFLCLDEEAYGTTSPAFFKAGSGLGNVQGFCVGFLAAAAVACSRDRTDFQRYSTVALHLAVCIGFIVDCDEETCPAPQDRSSSFAVCWKTDLEQAHFKRTLSSYPSAYISCITDENCVTVTVSLRDASSFELQLSEGGPSWQSIGLNGRFHHPIHLAAVQSLKELCKKDNRLQFPDAECMALPMRSDSTSEIITQGPLHEIALDSILARQSHWYRTVRATVASTGTRKVKIMTVGAGSFVPRSISTELNSQSVRALIPDGRPPEQSVPHQPSSHPGLSEGNEDDPKTRDAGVPGSEIAVVGMACRFPEADSPEEFWDLIESGSCTVRQLPKDRFDTSDLLRNPKGPFFGNFLRDFDAFDNRFFGISGREARSMDPQQRLLLHVAYEAMESCGYFGLRSNEQTSDIGCYLGVGSVDYGDNVASHDATAFSALGTLRAFISGKVSHHFGWTGPSITYDTACSSSAVAIHSACKALQARECSMAIAGGVNVMTSPALFQNLAAASFLSPTGASKAFDANANGYCRGEGVGLVVLKPLGRAIADGDFVLGVIAGSAVNQGSNQTPITVPVSQSQSSLYRQALFASGASATEVSFVEAHGTGTPVGDPIEWESIRQTFGGPHRTEDLFLGSVKDNIGHTEAASGVAAFLKVVLMMQNRMIPKQANFIALNPRITSSTRDRMTVPKHSQPWTPRKLSAFINNYGAAGSNAAIFVHEHSAFDGHTSKSNGCSAGVDLPEYPFFLSARSPQSLFSNCLALQSFAIKTRESGRKDAIASLSYNLARKQNRALEYFWTSTASNLTDLSDQLEAAAAAPINLRKKADPVLPVVLCFAGQAGKTVTLSEELFYNCKPLQARLVECDSQCQTLGLPSIFPAIFRTEPVDDIVSLHCILFSLQYASAKCWLDCGLKVETLIGHSFGQLTALCVAGCLSLTDGVILISTRARLIRDQWGSEKGAMVALEGDLQDAETLLAHANKQHQSCTAEIACYNGPRHFVLAGSTASIEAIEAQSQSEEFAMRVKVSRLNNTHAFHSQLADSILPGLSEIVKTLDFKEPSIHIETCSPERSWSRIGAREISQHTRMPVYFSQAVERVAERQKSSVWLEAAPGSSVVAMARRVLKENSGTQHIFQSMDLGGPNAQSNLAKASSQLWAAGSNPQFWPFHSAQNRFAWINLPPYQFEKTRHWMEYKPSIKNVIEAVKPPTEKQSGLVELLGNENINSDEVVFSVDPTNEFFVLCTQGHAVLHNSLCPASMYFELAIRAAYLLADGSSGTVPHVQDFTISSPLGLSPVGGLFLLLSRDRLRAETWQFSISSGSSQDVPARTVHATGNVALLASDDTTAASRFQSLNRMIKASRCEHIMNSQDATGLKGNMIYKSFGRVVEYADYYRGVKLIFAHDQEVVGQVSVSSDRPPSLARGCCDAIAIDNFLQVAGIHINCLADCNDDEVFVCTAIGDLLSSKRFSHDEADERSYTVYSNFGSISKKGVVNDILVFDSRSGDLVLTLMGAQFTSISFKSLEKRLSRLNGIHESEDLDMDAIGSGTSSKQLETFDQREHRQVSNVHDDPSKDEVVSSGIKDKGHRGQLLKEVQDLFEEVLELSTSDIHLDSPLADLGVDSLMITEVLSEIKTRFRVTISPADFQELTDIQSLLHRLQPTSSSQTTHENAVFRSASRPERVLQPSEVTKLPDTYDQINSRDVAQRDFAKIARTSLAGAENTFDQVARDTHFAGFCHSVYPAQAELVVAYVVEAFTSLGCSLASLGPGHRLPDIDHSSHHAKVMAQLYNILEDADLITRRAGVMQRTEKPCPKNRANTLQAALVEKYPQHASEHELLHTTGHMLAECLNGRVDPLSLLFRDAKSRSLLEDVYTNAPMFRSGTIFLADYLVSVFRQYDSESEIKILELGAGTGGTTSYLIESLSKRGQKFSYTFTDLSSSMVGAARRKFARHEFMQYATLDIEESPPPHHLGQYDIVISTNCIHATHDLTKSCTNIRKMLRPDGILCLVELTQNLFWFDLVFGLLEGWWLFEDGREHVLANERLWDQNLRRAGFQWVEWTKGDSAESRILRVIVASPSKGLYSSHKDEITDSLNSERNLETVMFKQEGETQLLADIYYPEEVGDPNSSRPVALMIHGGGHIMLSRKDIRPKQTKTLLDAGFLPVSVDYRLCPEITLPNGPMRDVCDALKWARNELPELRLKRSDIRANGSQIVAIGWSTGGHLAMTLAWTAPAQAISPPQAILSLYSPTDYHDPFWTLPNVPRGAEHIASEAQSKDDGSKILRDGIFDKPITAYNVPSGTRTIGGWLAPNDLRSRIALHMNWNGQTLPVLLCGATLAAAGSAPHSKDIVVPKPEQIASVSPLAQIQRGTYRTPTFIVHGTLDDLIPWQQSQRTHVALVASGVEAGLRVVEGAVHLFDSYHGFERDVDAAGAVADGYRFLGRWVGLG